MRLLALAVVALLLGPTGPARALSSAGLGNEDISARSLGMGGVGIAQAVEPASAFFNPAALPSIEGFQATVGGTLILPHASYESPSGATEGMRPIGIFTPNMALSIPLIPGKLHAGLAVESPYGGDNRFANNGQFRYLNVNSLFHMVDVSPSLGWQVMPTLSVGVSAHYYDVVDVTGENNVNESVLNTVLGSPGLYPDADSTLKGDGRKLGVGASLFYTPAPGHALGLTWRSKVVVPISGQLRLSGLSGPSAAVFGGSSYMTDASVDFPLPSTIQLGYSWRPAPQWTLEADVAWYGWSAFENEDVHFAETDPTRLSILRINSQGGTGPEPKNWRDTTNFDFGAEYRVNETVSIRGGYAHEASVSPDSTFSPTLVDLTRHEISAGLGLALAPVTIDAAYVLVLHDSRTIQNNVGASSLSSVNGTWSNTTHLVVLNLSKKF